jgi:hypothetical protein
MPGTPAETQPGFPGGVKGVDWTATNEADFAGVGSCTGDCYRYSCQDRAVGPNLAKNSQASNTVDCWRPLKNRVLDEPGQQRPRNSGRYITDHLRRNLRDGNLEFCAYLGRIRIASALLIKISQCAGKINFLRLPNAK